MNISRFNLAHPVRDARHPERNLRLPQEAKYMLRGR